MYVIAIDKKECIGCGSCVAISPENFELKGGKASAKRKDVEELGNAKDAADSCPVGCIKITQK